MMRKKSPHGTGDQSKSIGRTGTVNQEAETRRSELHSDKHIDLIVSNRDKAEYIQRESNDKRTAGEMAITKQSRGLV